MSMNKHWLSLLILIALAGSMVSDNIRHNSLNARVTNLEDGWKKTPVTLPVTISHITPAADLAISEDEVLEFAPSQKDKDGITFYPIEQDGKKLDVYVQLDPKTKEPRLFSYPADRKKE